MHNSLALPLCRLLTVFIIMKIFEKAHGSMLLRRGKDSSSHLHIASSYRVSLQSSRILDILV